jgi:predicted metal-binding membrane protein
LIALTGYCKFDITKQRNYILVKSNYRRMNNLNIFIVLGIVAASSLFLGVAMATPALAQDNMSMSMDNSSMPMDNMGNMTMGIDNSTSMSGNSTTQ